MADPSSFLATAIAPGSSLNPTFLFILDTTFCVLLLVLLSLAYLTSGNGHVFAIVGIELGLWGTVKWFVSEVEKIQTVEGTAGTMGDTSGTEIESNAENKKDS